MIPTVECRLLCKEECKFQMRNEIKKLTWKMKWQNNKGHAKVNFFYENSAFAENLDVLVNT
jgi:hypothetical protein